MVRYDLSTLVNDQGLLQSKWLMIHYENAGMISKSPLDRLPRRLRLISGNSFELGLPSHNPTDVGTSVLDADTIPRTNTRVTTIRQKARSTWRGIYHLLRDLMVLVTADPFKQQPNEFRGALGNTLDGFIHARARDERLVTTGSLFPQQIEKEHNGIFLAVEMADHLPPCAADPSPSPRQRGLTN